MKLQYKHEEDFRNYLDNIGLKAVTTSKHLLYYNHFGDLFGWFLTQDSVDSFLQQKTTPNHRAMISHLLSCLKRDSTLSPEEQLEISRIVPLKQVGRKKKNNVIVLTKEEISKLIGNCKLPTPFQTDRFKLMVLFQYYAGLRIHEVTHLRCHMLQYQGRAKFFEDERDKLKYQKLYLPPEISKGNKGRAFYIKTDIYLKYFDFLNSLKDFNSGMVNSILSNKKSLWGLNKQKYSKFFKEQVFEVLGVRLPDNKSTHILRSSRCTHLLQEGMPLLDVKDFMGHSSVSITEGYLSLAKDRVKKELEKL